VTLSPESKKVKDNQAPTILSPVELLDKILETSNGKIAIDELSLAYYGKEDYQSQSMCVPVWMALDKNQWEKEAHLIAAEPIVQPVRTGVEPIITPGQNKLVRPTFVQAPIAVFISALMTSRSIPN